MLNNRLELGYLWKQAFVSLAFSLPDLIRNSLYCVPYSSYNASSENLLLD